MRDLEKEFRNRAQQEKLQEEKNMEIKFEPYDRVLVRNHDNEVWQINLFSHKVSDLYHCINGGCFRQCIPYEVNQYLLNTTEPVKFFEFSEKVFFFRNNGELVHGFYVCLNKDNDAYYHYIKEFNEIESCRRCFKEDEKLN
ncbi:MAG: hypothetical protein IJS50_03260 [Desulfovibrio sp.]|nr:hypothetical protein [Desulfovibrio sp.]